MFEPLTQFDSFDGHTIIYVLWICWAHWLGDAVLQTDEQAKNKSSSFIWLSKHIAVYTLVMSVFFGPVFGLINGAVHFVVDAISSRISKYYWLKEQRHNFFVVVLADQAIHLSCLVLTMKYIWKW